MPASNPDLVKRIRRLCDECGRALRAPRLLRQQLALKTLD
ncbi:hypothetical protein [Methylophaga lonarensis]